MKNPWIYRLWCNKLNKSKICLLKIEKDRREKQNVVDSRIENTPKSITITKSTAIYVHKWSIHSLNTLVCGTHKRAGWILDLCWKRLWVYFQVDFVCSIRTLEIFFNKFMHNYDWRTFYAFLINFNQFSFPV